MLREDLKLKIETRLHSLEVTPDSVAVGKGNSKIESIKDSTVDPLKVLIKNCSDRTRLRRKVAWFLRFIQFIKDNEKVQNGD